MGFRPSKKTPERSFGKAAVMNEAMARKRGGRVFDKDKDNMKKGGACKADGGAVETKIEGKKSGGRLDKFARGGRTGCESHPYSGAKID